MNTPEEIVNEVLEDTYGGGTRYAEPNYWDEAGLTLALARGDVDESAVRELILRAIEIDRAQFFDTAGSASSQHYIDTGRYLLHEEVAEMERINQP